MDSRINALQLYTIRLSFSPPFYKQIIKCAGEGLAQIFSRAAKFNSDFLAKGERLTPELTERGNNIITAKSSDKINAIRAPVE